MDDGSGDDTPARLAEYRPAYPFRFFSQENGGPASARNRGVREARGRIVLFLGDDTVPEPPLLGGARKGPCRAAHASDRRARLHDLAARPSGVAVSPPDQRVRPAVRLRTDPRSRAGALQLLLHLQRLAAARAPARSGALRHELPPRRVGGHRGRVPPHAARDADAVPARGGRPSPSRHHVRRRSGEDRRRPAKPPPSSTASIRSSGISWPCPRPSSCPSGGHSPSDSFPCGRRGRSVERFPGHAGRSSACSATTTSEASSAALRRREPPRHSPPDDALTCAEVNRASVLSR